MQIFYTFHQRCFVLPNDKAVALGARLTKSLVRKLIWAVCPVPDGVKGNLLLWLKSLIGLMISASAYKP
jgi:hypothetical protein